jgi:NADPH2:quinone reductase
MGQAIVIGQTGGPEVLALRDHEVASPGPGQVKVHVEAAGLNFIDTYFRTGAYPAGLPLVVGLEGGGVVEAVGEGASRFDVGDRVAWSQVFGSCATEVLAPEDSLIAVPDGVTTEVAAAAMLQGMTAHYLVNGVRDTKPGDTALVHAAAGGTGLLLTQMLKAKGARVLGTCSTDEKEALARGAGADEVIRYTDVDVVAAVKGLTGGTGVDVVYDSVGKDTFEASLKCLRPRGLMVLFGQASGAPPEFDLQRLNRGGSLFITRPSLAHYVSNREELEMRAGAVLGAIATADIDVRIGARFPLADAADAHRALEGRKTTGKVLLIP